MKKLFSLFLVFSLIFALAACSSTPAAAPTDAPTEAPTDEPTAEPASAGSDTNAKTKLVVGTSADFPPYEYYEGGDGKIVGIDIDLAQAIADILKMELAVQDIAFDSIVTSVQTGKADIGVAGLTVTEDRLENVDFTEPYTTSTQVIIVRAK